MLPGVAAQFLERVQQRPRRPAADCAACTVVLQTLEGEAIDQSVLRSPLSSGWAMISFILAVSSSPSQRLTTMVATPFPITLVKARHSLMNLSMPIKMASD